jgi:hypothetical protein
MKEDVEGWIKLRRRAWIASLPLRVGQGRELAGLEVSELPLASWMNCKTGLLHFATCAS